MSTRRTFLKQSSFAASALLVTKESWFAAKQKTVGLQLYTVRAEITKDVKATIAKVAEVGYNEVETFGYGNGKYFGFSVEDFGAILKDNKLTTPSGHYMMMDFLGKGDEDQLKRTVADAAKLHHEYFTIPFLTPDLRKNFDDYKKLADNLNKAGEEAKKAGMKLAYHNHDFEFKDWGNGDIGYHHLMQATDPKLVNFEMDIYWVTKAGVDPKELMKAHPGRFCMWHVKDMDNTPEKSFTEVGSGVINYKEIFKLKKISGMKHFFVEQDQTKIPVYESIAKSYAYISTNLVS